MIREGNICDAAAIAAIYNEYVETSNVIFSEIVLSPSEMREKIQRLGLSVDYPFFVAEDNGEVAGYAYAHAWQPDPVYRYAWELTIYLSPDHCGKGYGTRLVEALVAKCREMGAHALIADITEGNTASERLFTKAGFKCVGIVPEVGYKFGEWHNDAFYQLIL